MGARVMMMGVVLVTAVLLETVVGPALSVGPWRPAIVVLTVVGFAFAGGPGTGVRYGAAAGLAVDLVGDTLIGPNLLVLALVGYAVGALRPYLPEDSPVPRWGVAGAAAAGSLIASTALQRLLGLQQGTGLSIVQGALVIGILDAMIAPLALRPLASLARRFAPAPVPG